LFSASAAETIAAPTWDTLAIRRAIRGVEELAILKAAKGA